MYLHKIVSWISIDTLSFTPLSAEHWYIPAWCLSTFSKIKVELSDRCDGPENMSFLNQYMVGTGLPDALHSSVTVLPFLAVTWPLCGRARRVGGTEINESTRNSF